MVGVGERLGGYELLAKLGSGGMATLYVARRAGAAGFERPAAVKVVHPHLAENERFVLMFIDEAKLAACIHHPNVVRVEDFGEHDGTYYMAMEYVHGCSLSTMLRALAEGQRRMGTALAVHIAMAVADGLHAAHGTKDREGRSLELVHRDISPQNVLLGYSGHVKLIDFGIAKARYRAQESRSQRLKGKLAYMAPEQVRMRALDRRTDVYALGIVLWEMLTMQRYFAGASELALLDQLRAPDVRPPSMHVTIDRELDEVVLSALAVDPSERPQSARELRQRLAAACPDALAIEAADVAELLAELMPGERERATMKMPAMLTRDLEGPPPESLAGRRALTESIDSAGNGWTDESSDVRESTQPDYEPAEVPPLRAPTRATEIAIPEPPARGKRSGAWWLVGLAVLAMSVGVGAGLLVTGEDDREPAPHVEVDRAPPVSVAEREPPATRVAPIPNPPREEPVIEEPPSERAARCAQANDPACVVEALAGRAQSAEELAMLADAHGALGQRDLARRAAHDYVDRHPGGSDASRMRALLPTPRRPARPTPSALPSAPRDLPFSDTM